MRVVVLAVVIILNIPKDRQTQHSDVEKMSLKDIKNTYQKEAEDAKNGKYSNLNSIELNTNLNNINDLYQINIEKNSE